MPAGAGGRSSPTSASRSAGRRRSSSIWRAALRPGEREVRIVTSMRIYWDQILRSRRVGAGRDCGSTRLDPLAATLALARLLGGGPAGRPRAVRLRLRARVARRRRGRRCRAATRARATCARCCARPTTCSSSRPGRRDRALLRRGRGRPLPAGWTRTFLLHGDGFSKEMDINSASPDAVEPLPFHAMTRYPYAAPRALSRHAGASRYRERYNTRVVGSTRAVAGLDPLAATSG